MLGWSGENLKREITQASNLSKCSNSGLPRERRYQKSCIGRMNSFRQPFNRLNKKIYTHVMHGLRNNKQMIRVDREKHLSRKTIEQENLEKVLTIVETSQRWHVILTLEIGEILHYTSAKKKLNFKRNRTPPDNYMAANVTTSFAEKIRNL